MKTITISDFLALCDEVAKHPYADYPTDSMDCNGHEVSVSDMSFNTVVIDGRAVSVGNGQYVVDGVAMSYREYIASIIG